MFAPRLEGRHAPRRAAAADLMFGRRGDMQREERKRGECEQFVNAAEPAPISAVDQVIGSLNYFLVAEREVFRI